MGAYKIGEIKAITDFINPKYGILTGLGNQHLDLFGSKENIIKAKSELLHSLPKDGIAYVNADCEGYQKAIARIKAKVLTYSITKQDTDIKATNIKSTEDGNEFIFCFDKYTFPVKTNLLGSHNILNLLPCIALALEFKIPQENIVKAISSLQSLENHLQKTVINKKITLIEDNSNSNLNGFLSAIEILKLSKSQNKILISKGIIELGKAKSESYAKILNEITKADILLLTTEPAFKKAIKNITTDKLKVFSTEDEIFNYVSVNLKEKNVILLEGRFSQIFINKLKQIQ
jgi:UDP-N-acetylmuramoyl-tripeptide--D-alanyl-D-alanine ligase